eukprot:358371-Chlamydomonas_euryale.AAC.3
MRLPDAQDAWTFSARWADVWACGRGVWACGSGLCGGVPEASGHLRVRFSERGNKFTYISLREIPRCPE